MKLFQSRAVNQPSSNDPFLDHVISITSTDNTTFTSVRALKNSDVFTAVKIIASDIASNPIQLTKNAMPEADNNIVKLLNSNPNSVMDGWHFKFALAVSMLLNGNSFAEIIRENGKAISLEFLPNSSVVVKQDDTGNIFYEVEKRKINSKNILHFKYFTQDGLTGIPPLFSLQGELKIQEAGNKTMFNFFNRGVNGSGILTVNKSDLDAEAKESIRKKFEQANGSSGGENSLRTIILDETMEYKTLEVNTDVLKLINSNDYTTKQIAKCFGIPNDRLGVENSHSSTVQGNMLYLQNTLSHYFSCFTSELNKKLLNDSSKSFRFNTEQLLMSDPETMISNTLKQVQGSLLTINEARAKLGLPPVNNGDRLIASLNYTYLDTLEQYQMKGDSTNGPDGTRETIE